MRSTLLLLLLLRSALVVFVDADPSDRTLLQIVTHKLLSAFSSHSTPALKAVMLSPTIAEALHASDAIAFAAMQRIEIHPLVKTPTPTKIVKVPSHTQEEVLALLTAFYHTYGERMVSRVPSLAKKFKGREDDLNEFLRKNYGGADMTASAFTSTRHSLSYHPGKGSRHAEPVTWQLPRLPSDTVFIIYFTTGV